MSAARAMAVTAAILAFTAFVLSFWLFDRDARWAPPVCAALLAAAVVAAVASAWMAVVW